MLAINRYGRVIKDPEYKESKDAKKADPASNLAPGEVKLPSERVGLLMIFRTFDRISYGLIMSTSDAIYTLDSVQTP